MTRSEWPKRLGLWLGPCLAAAVWLAPPPETWSEPAWRTAGLAVWMAVWWFSEALPLPATALLPLIVLPLAGVSSLHETATAYAHPVIFLFLGGFVIARALQVHGLSRAFAGWLLARIGTTPARVVAAFFIAGALLSMGVSNTATALMLAPIARATLAARPESAPPGGEIPLLLAVAYGCNIGGMASVIGTPPNALAAAYLDEAHAIEISFVQWLAFGLPLVVVAAALGIVLLTRVLYPVAVPAPRSAGHAPLSDPPAAWGRARLAGAAPRRVVWVTAGTVLAWLFQPLLAAAIPGINDTVIALVAALALFALPAGRGQRLLDWGQAAELPWGILLLFGGGLALAGAIEHSGLNAVLGGMLHFLVGLPVWVLIAGFCAFMLLLTELTSNTASTAAFLPLAGSLALAAGLPPWQLAIPTALAASGAFMLPVATPPNAVVFGGRLTIRVMARAGIGFNLLLLALITLTSVTLLPAIMGN